MTASHDTCTEALLVALPESAGSSLYGMIDVLGSTGTLWRELEGEPPGPPLIRPRILGVTRSAFRARNGVPMEPELCVDDDPRAPLLIITDLWLAPGETMEGRYPGLSDYIVRHYQRGGHVYSACTGSILLAATGLLSGRNATSHWAYKDLFRVHYPDILFSPQPTLCFGDASGRIVTAGGTTSWQDLAVHVIARHCSPGEAVRIAKIFLFKLHEEGQAPYADLSLRQSHADSVVRHAEDFLTRHFAEPHAVAAAVDAVAIPERSFKRRFKAATGSSPMDYVQALRIEAAKALLESGDLPTEEISCRVGYENPAFFRRLFERLTGLTPAEYRRMFQPIRRGGPIGGAVAAMSARAEPAPAR
ncbi:MAG: helix-turn-helix domain-containing protein [Alphaproteobacteria bacterium]|nr:helix-turn-helix domain-containing protein [Alphaproteobacteria bacterium]